MSCVWLEPYWFFFLLVGSLEYSIGRSFFVVQEGEESNKKKWDLPKMLAPTAEIKWLTSNASVGSSVVDVILEHFITAAESIQGKRRKADI